MNPQEAQKVQIAKDWESAPSNNLSNARFRANAIGAFSLSDVLVNFSASRLIFSILVLNLGALDSSPTRHDAHGE